MNAPIRYYGGKSLMYNNILQYFPPKEEYDTYIEPFGGSYSVGLKMEPARVEIYNDLEQNVYSLYKVLSDPIMFTEFKEKCDLSVICSDFYYEYKELLRTDDISITERAFYFFYVNRLSFNGSGDFSTNISIRRSMSKSVSDFLSAIDRLPELHNRLSRIVMLNTDGNNLIKKYNNPRVLHYCDPPYEQSTRTSSRYKQDMDRDGHINFLDAVIGNKSKIIISGYECELYEQLTENGFKKYQFDVKVTGGNFKAKTKIEYIWTNYEKHI